MEHLFRCCPINARIWQAGGLGIRGSMRPCINISPWVVNFLSLMFKQDKQDGTRAIEFISTLWALWSHRNEVVFKKKPCSQERIMGLADKWHNKCARDTQPTNEEGRIQVHKGLALTTAHWVYGRLAREGVALIVVDVAWKAFQKRSLKEWGASVAWKGENSEDNHIKGGRRICVESPLQAKCLAIVHGLR